MVRPTYGAACADVKRARTFPPMHPLLALGLLAIAGLLATRLPWVAAAVAPSEGAGAVALLALGAVLGPGIGVLDASTLAALSPATILVTAWAGVTLGVRWDRRVWRRVPPAAWAVVAAESIAVFGVVGLTAWLLARLLPPLAAVWWPRLAATLALASAALVSGPEAARLVTRIAQGRPAAQALARALRRLALLETTCGALAVAATAIVTHPRLPSPVSAPGWVSGLGVALGAPVLVALLLRGLLRLAPSIPPAFAFGTVLLFGAGLGTAAGVSPFVIGAVAGVCGVHAAPNPRRLRAELRAWRRPLTTFLYVLAGAWISVPTWWIVPAAALLASARIAAKWSTLRSGLARAPAAGLPPHAGLATIAQGQLAVGVALGYALSAGGAVGAGSALTTIVLAVVLAQLAARGLTPLAFSGLPLTHPPLAPELSPDSSAD